MGGEDEKEMFGIACRHDASGGYIVKNSGCEQGNLNNDKIYHTNVDDSTARTSWVWGLNRTKTWLLIQFVEHFQQPLNWLLISAHCTIGPKLGPMVPWWIPWSAAMGWWVNPSYTTLTRGVALDQRPDAMPCNKRPSKWTTRPQRGFTRCRTCIGVVHYRLVWKMLNMCEVHEYFDTATLWSCFMWLVNDHCNIMFTLTNNSQDALKTGCRQRLGK